MDGVTLLESKTSRVHFAFIKRLEGAKTTKDADKIIHQTIEEVRSTLQSKETSALSESTIASQLLILLHCFQLYPFEDLTGCITFDLSFALVPTLHLLAITQYARRLQIAYSTLALLIGPFALPSNELQASSLLVLNTIRQHLGSQTHTSISQRHHSEGESSIQRARQYFALRSIIKAIPSGSDCVPALYGPVSALITHEDDGIKALAIEALFVLNGYRQDEEDKGVTRATYERICEVVAGTLKRKGKQKVRSSSKNESRHDLDSLKRSFVKVSRMVVSQHVISVEDFITTLISLDEGQSSTWMKLHIAKNLSQTISKGISEAGSEATVAWLSTGCSTEDALGHNPLLLEIARLLGIVKSNSAEIDGKAITAEVWRIMRGHLQSRNANRRILSLNILDALLPLGWHLQESDIQLSEKDMNSLMSLLSDTDNTVRIYALRLFFKVDIGIITTHLDALQKAAEEESRSIEETSSLCLRICETLRCMCDSEGENSLSKLYSPRIEALLRLQSVKEHLDDRFVEKVAQDFEQYSAMDTAMGVATLTKNAFEAQSELSATHTLLLSTLVCTSLEQSQDEKVRSLHQDIAQDLSAILPLVGDKNPPLQDAMMVAIYKMIALIGSEEAQHVFRTISNTAENSNSAVIRHRTLQLSECILHGKLEELARLMKRSSLLSTLDRIEEVVSQIKSNSGRNSSKKWADQQISPKPLHYDPYSSPESSNHALSYSQSPKSDRKSTQTFNSLPTPSEMRKQALAEQNKHSAMKRTIHQSIAQLTLGGDDVNEAEYNSTIAIEDDGKGEKDRTEETLTAPCEGVLF